MSSRPQRKNALPKKSTVPVTKVKTGQRGRPRKKIANVTPPKQPPPSLPPTPVLPEATPKCSKVSPLQQKVRTLVKLVEQTEYYPDKLKRVLSKKTFMKPIPNLKIVASTNKRKLTVPKRQGSPPLKRRSPSPELSMAAMVRLIEEKNALSDEDFMEILTCASPVWWEDPPHPFYVEEPICRRVPSPTTPSSNNLENHKPQKSIDQISSSQSSMDFESAIDEFNKITPKKTGKFIKKQQKLESVLGNLKTVKNKVRINEIKNKTNNRRRKFSNSTDGDLSDLSFNEEEILKNLESMEIPIEQNEIETSTKSNEMAETKPVIIPDILPPLTRKPNIIEIKMKSDTSDSNSDYSENISHSNFRFISDDDISSETSENTDKKTDSSNSSPAIHVGSINVRTDLLINSDSSKIPPKKIVNDQTEYITVYKIMSNDDQSEKREQIKNINNNKIENVKGKLNSFFKKCKSNKRIKKSESPAVQVTAVNNLKSKSRMTSSVVTDENRLNCECQQTKNGTINVSCKCEKVFECSLCDFHADSKEVYAQHLSSCKVMVSMPWNRSYLMNQT